MVQLMDYLTRLLMVLGLDDSGKGLCLWRYLYLVNRGANWFRALLGFVIICIL
jgi:hypothetical protein